MNPPATTRLILLPRDPAHPATCLELDPRGRILSRRPLDPAHPAPPGPAARTVVAVPGEAVRTLWLDLPAHNPVQALAAARILLQEHVAGDLDGLHIAIGPSGQGPRLLAVADDAQVHAWRQRAQALGVVPDALVPVQLLADAPADRPLQVLEHDGLWLVRGPQLALAAEPALAQRIIGTRGMRQVEDAAAVEALLAAGAAAAIPGGIDLLQYAHARPRDRAVSSRRRRLALLAALCLLSPLLLQGASALRHALGAHWLERQAGTLAAARLPEAAPGTAVATVHARHRELSAPGQLALQVAALSAALERLPQARVDSLEYAAGGGLAAGLVHAGEADLEVLREPLAAAGFGLSAQPGEPVDGGLRTLVTLEPAR